jgi:hypothetical protein
MITSIVQFELPEPITREQARDAFMGSAPNYQGTKGLIRKYYTLSPDGKTAGGVYLWDSQTDAENLYTDDWKKFIFDKYGAHPTINYLECPVIVDNVTGDIVTDA